MLIMLTLNPLNANAEWRDRSGDLPGTVSDGTVAIVAGVGVVLIGGLIYVLVKAKKQQTSSLSSENNYLGLQTSVYDLELRKIINQAKVNPQEFFVSTSTQGESIVKSTIPKVQPINGTSKLPIDITVAPIHGNSFAFGNSNGVQLGIMVRF